MNPVFAGDLRWMMADFGQPVSWGAYSTTGILSVATEDVVDQDGYAIVRGETPTLAYPKNDLPGLKRRDQISIDGTDYMVRRVDLEGDGLHATAYLEMA